MKSFFSFIAALGIVFASTEVRAGQDVLLASAARTATVATATQYRTTENAAHIIINVTAVTTCSIVPTLSAIDALGISYTLLTGAAITSTGTTVLKIGRGIGQITSAAAADLLPDQYYLTMTAGNSNSCTYSVTINRDP